MYKTVLLPVDLDEKSSWEKALPVAVQLCRDYGATLHLVTVIPDYGMTVVGQYFRPEAEQELADRAWRELHALIEAEVPDDVTANAIMHKGSIYQQIIETGTQIGADLIVMASHRPAVGDFLLGPNAAKVVRHYDRSVLVVRP